MQTTPRGQPAGRFLYRREAIMKCLHVVGAAAVEGGKILAAKRGESRYAYVAHKYEFAGGKVEAGESEEDALRREIFEELGAKIQVGGLLCRLEHDYPDFSVRLSVYFCKFLTPYFSKEHEALAWLPIEELDTAEWAPADAPAVERLKKLYREGGAAFCGIRQAEDEKR